MSAVAGERHSPSRGCSGRLAGQLGPFGWSAASANQEKSTSLRQARGDWWPERLGKWADWSCGQNPAAAGGRRRERTSVRRPPGQSAFRDETVDNSNLPAVLCSACAVCARLDRWRCASRLGKQHRSAICVLKCMQTARVFRQSFANSSKVVPFLTTFIWRSPSRPSIIISPTQRFKK